MKQVDIDIKEIISKELITTRFQPIYCAKRRKILAVEALSRGYIPQTDTIIAPDTLFCAAKEEGLLLELDRLCRKKAIEAYAGVSASYKDLLLFINIDTSILDDKVVGSKVFLHLIRQFNLDPSKILIEIIESDVQDNEQLHKFVKMYRENGFLIGIDDIGAGHSNLNRISLIKPDILKIDREIIHDINKEYHKREVLKAMVGLAKNIGALVVAEGVETEQETMTALEIGADLFQGYYFTKPMRPDELPAHMGSSLLMENIIGKFKMHFMEKINDTRKEQVYYSKLASEIISCFAQRAYKEYENCLAMLLPHYREIEYAYVINSDGIQITETIENSLGYTSPKSKIYSPDAQGADQSMKDYYIFIKAGLDTYVTDPYISFASGNKSITISTLFTTNKAETFILCLDIITDLK